MKKKLLSRENIPALLAIGTGAWLLVAGVMRRARRISFRGASVIVTGGSRGLGLEISRLLAREGARLTLLARDRVELERARRELISLGGYVMIRECDIGDPVEVKQAVEFVIRERRRIDVLINNAGTIQVGPFENMENRDLEDALDVYVRGPFYFMKEAAPHMKHQGGGRIVNVCSIAGLVPIPHLVTYSAAKAAMTGLSDGARAELAKDNIFVTTVQPGFMRTGSHLHGLFKGQHEKEFSWFALSEALPLFSVNAERAAQQIIEACRHGDAYSFISAPARVLQLFNTLFPGTAAVLMKQAVRALPTPVEAGNKGRTGWESQSGFAPSFRTRLADRATIRNKEQIPEQGKALSR